MKTKTFDVDGAMIQTVESTEQQSSIKVTRNAKGEHTYEVKVYCDDKTQIEIELKDYIRIAKAIIGE